MNFKMVGLFKNIIRNSKMFVLNVTLFLSGLVFVTVDGETPAGILQHQVCHESKLMNEPTSSKERGNNLEHASDNYGDQLYQKIIGKYTKLKKRDGEYFSSDLELESPIVENEIYNSNQATFSNPISSGFENSRKSNAISEHHNVIPSNPLRHSENRIYNFKKKLHRSNPFLKKVPINREIYKQQTCSNLKISSYNYKRDSHNIGKSIENNKYHNLKVYETRSKKHMNITSGYTSPYNIFAKGRPSLFSRTLINHPPVSKAYNPVKTPMSLTLGNENSSRGRNISIRDVSYALNNSVGLSFVSNIPLKEKKQVNDDIEIDNENILARYPGQDDYVSKYLLLIWI